MKSSIPETQCGEGIFQVQHHCLCILTLQIKYQGQADHDTIFENS